LPYLIPVIASIIPVYHVKKNKMESVQKMILTPAYKESKNEISSEIKEIKIEKQNDKIKKKLKKENLFLLNKN
jgi:hypothetical protein